MTLTFCRKGKIVQCFRVWKAASVGELDRLKRNATVVEELPPSFVRMVVALLGYYVRKCAKPIAVVE